MRCADRACPDAVAVRSADVSVLPLRRSGPLDNALGRISEEQFAFLTSGYGEERKSLSERIVELKKEINTVAERGADVKRFLDTLLK